MSNTKSQKPEFFVDNEKHQWPNSTITEAELRALAGVPDGVQIFQEIPGQRDFEILPGTVIDLTAHALPERFSTQATGSQAG